LIGETPRFRKRFKLPVDILGITLLSDTDTAYDCHGTLTVNSVHHPMIAELVLPIPGQRTVQWQAVPFRVHG